MNFEEQIGYGHMSLGELSAIVVSNLHHAETFGLRMHWHFEGGGIRAKVYREKEVLFDKIYKGKFVHIHIAEMHCDWKHFFAMEGHRRKQEARKAQQEADRNAKDLDKMTVGARIAFMKKLGGEDETSQVPVGED